MKAALDETARRREKQIAHNLAEGITPTSIAKRVHDVMKLGYEAADATPSRRAAEKQPEYARMSPEKLAKLLAKLEKEMRAAAQNLEFELAAKKRDELRKLRESALGAKSA